LLENASNKFQHFFFFFCGGFENFQTTVHCWIELLHMKETADL